MEERLRRGDEMTSILLYVSGVALILFTITDLIWTTLWVDRGAGPMSKRIARSTWKITRRISKNEKGLFNIIGPLILVLTLLSWVLLLWIGLTLFFSGDPESIVQTTFEGPVMWYERLYFTGFTLFTLGVGDYSPQPGFWQVITALNSGIGILFLTLGASYVISVVSAVVKKRALAQTVTGLGMDSSEVMRKSWSGEGFYQLDLFLMNASSQITELTQQHQAYPLLHYYHSQKPQESSAVGIAILDDVLTVVHHGLADKGTVNMMLICEARSSIETYLETMTSAFIEEAENEPPYPDWTDLKELKLPLVEEEEFSERIQKVSHRRRKLLGAVKADNHEWPQP